jgi:hypothetical protein
MKTLHYNTKSEGNVEYQFVKDYTSVTQFIAQVKKALKLVDMEDYLYSVNNGKTVLDTLKDSCKFSENVKGAAVDFDFYSGLIYYCFW